MKIADIKIGERHRQDLGDIAALANSIKTETLLQPIGITENNELVFGYRRLIACRDLGWTEIDARVVNVTSIVAGEYAENEMRKDFTISERTAILRTIKRKPLGDQSRSKNFSTAEEAAKMAGFGNPTTARQATIIVDQGIPELVAAVDRGEIAIEPAFAVSLQPPQRQAEIISLPVPERRAAVGELARPGKNAGEGTRRRRQCAKPRECQSSETARQREARMLNRPVFKPQPAEVMGRPTGVAALEQDPNSPPGMNRAMAFTAEHGRVHVFPPDELARQRLYDRLIEFNSLIRRLVKDDDWPTYDDLATLDDRRRNKVLREWSRHRAALYAVLDAAIGHPEITITPVGGAA